MRLCIASSLGIFLFPFAALCDVWEPDPESARRAAVFVAQLATTSPRHDGVPLRRYEIRDLDHDGLFEVLQHSSEIEEASPGFLAVQDAPPTYWIDVYQEQDGEFRLSTGNFRRFLTIRIAFYERWIVDRSLGAFGSSGENPVLESVERNLERAKKLISRDAV